MVKLPQGEKIWLKDADVDLFSFTPSPKSHHQLLIVPALAVEASEKTTALSAQAVETMLYCAVGKGLITMEAASVSLTQPLSVMVYNRIGKVPAAAYKCTGCCKVSVDASPQLQRHLAIMLPFPSVLSVNLVLSLKQFSGVKVKAAFACG